MPSALKVQAARALKQLEFLIVRQTLRLPSFCSRPALSGRSGHGDRAPWLQRRDQALEQQAGDLLRSLGADKLARDIRVEWNPRLKTCAGRADYREKLVSLNPLLLDLADLSENKSAPGNLECNMHSSLARLPRSNFGTQNLECKMHSRSTSVSGQIAKKKERAGLGDEVDRTLRHELAHLLAQWRIGRRRIAPHGIEWRRACRDLGIADEARCHNLPFASKAYSRRYVYRCPNCKQEFPRVRKIRRVIACLACCRAYNRGEFDPRFRLKPVKSQQKETKETKKSG